MADRYEIRDQIGRGGLGAVYLAFDTQLQREVAIKRVLTTEHATEEEVKSAATKLMAEAQTLSTLNHPNIVTVFDIGSDKKGGFVVMELLKGETLDETVSRGVLTQEDFVEVVIQTMEALIAAQAVNVLHRDIKPTNVMVIWQASGKFQIKILDFGLAKFSKSPSVQTMDQDDAVMGSIYFMAPEQFERGELDERTDLYAMGCVYYHALTGQYPFRGETAPQVMNAHMQHRVTPLNVLRPDLAPSVSQWVMWLINRKMEDRPASARAALELFPKNPETETAVQVAQAIPVDEPAQGLTTGVHIVAPPSHAAAPPSGLVHTGRRQYSSRVRPSDQAKSNAGKMTLMVMGALVLLVVGWLVVKWIQGNQAENTLYNLAAKEEPAGDAGVVRRIVPFLAGETTQEEKKAAREVLLKLQGTGVEAAILTELQGATTSYERLTLSQILAERGYADAVPAILAAFNSAAGDSEKQGLLKAVILLANEDHAEYLINALGGEHSTSVRRELEQTILTIFRRQPRNDSNLRPLLDQAAAAEGDKLQSIFRILGALDGEAVKTRLQNILRKPESSPEKSAAMSALLHWPDRGMMPMTEELLLTMEGNPLRVVVVRAYVRMSTLPAPVTFEERSKTWKRALDIANNAEEKQAVFNSIGDYAQPESKKLLNELRAAGHPNGLIQIQVGRIDKVLKDAQVLEPGDLLEAQPSAIRGDGAGFDPEIKAISHWISPDTWFVFHFKVAKAGEYGVQVMQAQPGEAPSAFQLVIDDKTLDGESTPTGNWKDFKPVDTTGSLKLEADKVYTIHLRATQPTEPRMMNIQGIRLIE